MDEKILNMWTENGAEDAEDDEDIETLRKKYEAVREELKSAENSFRAVLKKQGGEILSEEYKPAKPAQQQKEQLYEVPLALNNKMLFCPYCGFRVAGMKFCGRCGKQVNLEVSEADLN